MALGDDWTGLYLNGRLIKEGHSFSEFEMLTLGISLNPSTELETITVNEDYLEYFGSLPDFLYEVVEEDEEFVLPDEDDE